MTVSISYIFVCFPQLLCLLPSLASQKPVLRGNTSRASKTLNQNPCHLCPPYLPICGISPPLQVNCSCATFKTFKTTKHVLCSCFSSWGSSLKFIMSYVKKSSSPSFSQGVWDLCSSYYCRCWCQIL